MRVESESIHTLPHKVPTAALPQKIQRSAVRAVGLAAILLSLLLLAACGGPASGPDSLAGGGSDEVSGGPRPTVACPTCHVSGGSLAPSEFAAVVPAAPGAAPGKHGKHVDERGFPCESCHFDYYWAGSHMDGRLDAGNPDVVIVRFDPANPDGAWNPGAVPEGGSCAAVACHGGVETGWYNTAPLTCVGCHATGEALDPVLLAGTGTAGKHEKHVQQWGLYCENCHQGYNQADTHADGVLDAGNPAVPLVRFDVLNPTADWVNDTGPQSGGCAASSCHGAPSVAWYDTQPWTPPACTGCHVPGGAIDPVALNGSGTAGKHLRHVGESNQACETCHFDYYGNPLHRNGQLDATTPGAALVAFNGLNIGAAWQDAPGSCAGTSCHGTAPVAWYDEQGWSRPADCLVCHGPGSPVDPLALNGTGQQGKHFAHVGTQGYPCETCHEGYLDAPRHIDGSLDGGDPTAALVVFSAANPSAAWTQDSGPHSGGCADTYCHGATDGVTAAAIVPYWYGTEAIACTSCHAPGSFIDPVALNGTGTAGQHQTHVVERGYPCETCHNGYTGVTSHVNFQRDTDDPAALLVAFDGRNPAASWNDDAGAGTGSCADTYCHGANDGQVSLPIAPSWYTAQALTCRSCHPAGGFADPVQRDRDAVNRGEHGEHVSGENIPCAICHGGYSLAASHADGLFDGARLATLIDFDPQVSTNPQAPTAAWVSDTGAGTGRCNGVCHWSPASESHGTSTRWYR